MNLVVAYKCRPGLVYHKKMSACPKTCRDPTAPDMCTLKDIEGCSCPDGMYLDEGICRDGDQCDCYDENKVSHRVCQDKDKPQNV